MYATIPLWRVRLCLWWADRVAHRGLPAPWSAAMADLQTVHYD